MHEWVEKGAIMYPGGSAGCMSVSKRSSHVSREECGIHEWVEKGAVMYPGGSVGYMSGMEKEQPCIPGGVRDT
ncbi:hypothetical protein [Bacillus sp. UMB0728]|uniref:hypothetical protein n=1 Tax=Bacillus sp. UMB0728 TaxID=2066052 RepID=UPI000C75A092|nr:hypothetical protein [Bacillus sp. UMB0728]PLR75020.1 hypothetical protein CYJ37_05280 [Bacillus sp. UMB0728]